MAVDMTSWIVTAAGRHPDWLTIEQAAAYLHVHSITLRRWMAGGRLRGYKLGPEANSPLRFKRADLDALGRPIGNDQADDD